MDGYTWWIYEAKYQGGPRTDIKNVDHESLMQI